MNIQIKKLSPEATIPSYAHPHDAGLDMFALSRTEILPGQRAQVRTGIAMQIPEGYVGLLWDKSGLSLKHGLKMFGGVIDSGYRGEILITIANLGSEPFVFEAGNKVAQMLIQKIEHAVLEEVDVLEDSARGATGFGSTGR